MRDVGDAGGGNGGNGGNGNWEGDGENGFLLLFFIWFPHRRLGGRKQWVSLDFIFLVFSS